DYALGVDQMGEVIGSRLAAAKYSVEFLVNTRGGLRIASEAIEQPGQAGSRGVMPGDKQRYGLVANLFVRKATAVPFFIDGEEKHRQQVALVQARRSPFAGEPAHGLVQSLHGPALAALSRQRQPVRQGPRGLHLLDG